MSVERKLINHMRRIGRVFPKSRQHERELNLTGIHWCIPNPGNIGKFRKDLGQIERIRLKMTIAHPIKFDGAILNSMRTDIIKDKRGDNSRRRRVAGRETLRRKRISKNFNVAMTLAIIFEWRKILQRLPNLISVKIDILYPFRRYTENFHKNRRGTEVLIRAVHNRIANRSKCSISCKNTATDT